MQYNHWWMSQHEKALDEHVIMWHEHCRMLQCDITIYEHCNAT